MEKATLAERTYHGLHEFLAESVASLDRSVAVLDVGCGTGAWLDRLADQGFTNLLGIDRDISQFGCVRARAQVLDVDRLGELASSGEYGLISAIEVIEHLSNPGHLWDLVATCLAPGGRFLLTTPNIHSLRARLRFLFTGRLPAFDAKGDPTHVQPMYFEGALRMMASRGLVVERVWTFPARGSTVFRGSISIFAGVLGLLVPDDMPGDTLCVEIRRRQ